MPSVPRRATAPGRPAPGTVGVCGSAPATRHDAPPRPGLPALCQRRAGGRHGRAAYRPPGPRRAVRAILPIVRRGGATGWSLRCVGAARLRADRSGLRADRSGLRGNGPSTSRRPRRASRQRPVYLPPTTPGFPTTARLPRADRSGLRADRRGLRGNGPSTSRRPFRASRRPPRASRRPPGTCRPGAARVQSGAGR